MGPGRWTIAIDDPRDAADPSLRDGRARSAGTAPARPVQDWLETRLRIQLEEDDPTFCEARPPSEDLPTDHGRRGGRARGEDITADAEPIDDPATVQADADGSLEGETDPHTVRIHRMPLSFIGESVIDPTTVQNTSAEAERWRAEASIDEVPMLRGLPSPTPAQRRIEVVVVPPTSVPAEPEEEKTNVVALLLTALVGGGLGLGFVLLWGWWML